MVKATREYSLLGLHSAEGLPDELRPLVRRAVKVYMDNMQRNMVLLSYYDDEHIASNSRETMPARFRKQSMAVGWCAKGVNMLADRSIMDRFAIPDGDLSEVESALSVDGMSEEYANARRTQLIFGCGFWCITRGDTKDGEPPAVVAFHDLLSSAAVWDWSRKRVRLGVAIEDWEVVDGVSHPSVTCVYDKDATYELHWDNGAWAVAQVDEHGMGRAAMVEMPFQPTSAKPFGRSRITKRAMEITDEMQAETANTMLHSELFSSPRRWILGVDPKFQQSKSDWELYMERVMTITRDRNGNVPTVGEFSQASMAPHIEYMEFLARQMASEMDLPMAAFGVNGNGYTSSDALRASTDDLIMAAESMNSRNRKAIRTVAVMAVAMASGDRYSDANARLADLSVRMVDPSMPSLAARADSMVKKASAIPWLAETTVALEDLGYDKETIGLLQGERDAAETRQAVNAMFAQGV